MSVCILCVKPTLEYTKSRVSLHKFPVCPNKRQIWLNRCGLTDEKILPHHKICSLHFKRSCFKSGVMRRKLYPDAEPTIFKKGQAKITNSPLKILEVKTGKSSKMSQRCMLCEKHVFRYPSPMESFHRFPVCPKKRQIWLNRCGLTNEEVLPNHKICSLHFKQSCFKPGAMRRRLYPDAEPTIFKKGHPKFTNMPLQNVKGKPKNCNKKGIAVQHHQSRDIFKTVNAVKKEISSQMRESSDISSKKVAKKLIFGKNHLSHMISPTKAVKEVICNQSGQSCEEAIVKPNTRSRVSLTKSVPKGIPGLKHESCNILQTKVCKEVVASQNGQSHDVSPIKSVQNEISNQNRESCDIALTRTVKRRIARQKRKSYVISQAKLSEEVTVDQNNQSHNVSPPKSVLKGIPDRKHESCDILPTKNCKEVVASQNGQSHDVSPTKSVQNEISGQICESCDESSRAFVEEVFNRTSIILENQKKESDELDLIIENLQKEKALLLSQIKILNDRLSRHNAKK